MASCAELSETFLVAGDGHMNRPRSRRFENRQAPWPSNQMILIYMGKNGDSGWAKTKDPLMARKRVFDQNLIGEGRQAVEAFPHIRDPGSQPDLRMGGYRDHDEARPLARRSTASRSKRPLTLSLCPEARAISI
jgi:hypothetical protein